MELAGETFYDRRESGLDIKIQNQQVRPTPDGYDKLRRNLDKSVYVPFIDFLLVFGV